MSDGYTAEMADRKRAYADNLAGDFFVDDTCIDCDLCRQIAPATFRESSDHSVVWAQPADAAGTVRALMALVACPTASIGTRRKHDVRPAIEAFPERVDDDVYFCGFAAEHSYGAASYLIVRPDGNILIDSPRFAGRLVSRIEALGGVSLMCLTHRDDVADHQKFHDHFGCDRLIHVDEARVVAAERVIDGTAAATVAPGLVAIPTPGHTRGHTVFLYQDTFLFTGDHLAWTSSGNRLIAFRSVTWYSWREQTESMRRLEDYTFEWVLPGHGRRAHLPAGEMAARLHDCLTWMRTVA